MSETILEEAIRLTSSDRQGQYGHPADHFARTVAGLNARFGTGHDPLFARDMIPHEWALMVAIDKLVGRGSDTRDIKRDSLVDVTGYCRTYEMCREREPVAAPKPPDKPRVYIAGPMRGHERYNFPAFDLAAETLRANGYDAVNPADLDRATGFDPFALPKEHDWTSTPPGFDMADCRRRDIEALETCCAIVMLPGWRHSIGAVAEQAHAEWMGIDVHEI